MILIPLGPPGSGKGTQAKRISAKRGWAHLSTGDMFRAAIQAGTPMGLKAKSFIDKGDLVPDDVTVGLIADRIQKPDCQAGFILDGFPRNIPQAVVLSDLLKKRSLAVGLVVLFDIPDEELVGRLTGRRVCGSCGAMFHLTASPPKTRDVCDKCGKTPLIHRSDDSEEVIRNRLSVYHRQTAPLIAFYQNEGKFKTLDATQSPDAVQAALERFL